MTKQRILQEGQSYTFRDYFKLRYPTGEVLAEFDYQFVRGSLSLPRSDRGLARLPEFQRWMIRTLELVGLTSEAARREAIVAPVLIAVADICNVELLIEYPLVVNQWLKGELDYLMKAGRLLVIEAKRDDLTRGFTQLAVELIALSQVEEGAVFYGAVTIGDAWRFGKLETQQKLVTQDITLYRVPDDLEQLMSILVGILELA